MSKLKIEYVDHMGNDLRVVNAARISMGKDSDVLSEGDQKLINYLAKHKHYTPFEHCQLSVIVHCPLLAEQTRDIIMDKFPVAGKALMENL